MKRKVLATAALALLWALSGPAAASACDTGAYAVEYYNNAALSGTPVDTGCERWINFQWGSGRPGSGVGYDYFSVRWNGNHSFEGGTYTFKAIADDGVRVWLDGNLIIDSWRNQPATTYTVDRQVGAGVHSLKVEYYENTGQAVMDFSFAQKGQAQSAAAAPAYFSLRPAGAQLPSGDECARLVRRSSWEPRPGNWTANHTTPGGYRIGKIDSADAAGQARLAWRIDGNFTGTTDEIIQWGACKWGFDEEYTRASSAIESWWNQAVVGDNGESYGLLGVKVTQHIGTWPWATNSTAFAVDYALAWRRACYEGHFNYFLPVNVTGDLWGCTGLWVAGHWWNVQLRNDYVAWVQRHMAEKPWLGQWF